MPFANAVVGSTHPPGPRLHFADIDALKAALAQRCFAEFAAARDQAAAGAADPAAPLIAGCQAYVRYGLDRPGEYRPMFSPDLPTLSPTISTGPTSPIDGSGSERAQPETSPSKRLRRSGQLDSTLPTRRHRFYRHRPHQAGRAAVDRPARTGVAAHERPRLPLATAREHDHRTRHPTHQSSRRGLANWQCGRDDRASTAREAALRHAAGCAGADPRRTPLRSGKQRAAFRHSADTRGSPAVAEARGLVGGAVEARRERARGIWPGDARGPTKPSLRRSRCDAGFGRVCGGLRGELVSEGLF